MLSELTIQGIGVIDDAHLEFSPSLTVVTGETGAGKTMIVTALNLLMGAKLDPSLVRVGHSLALVEGVLTSPDEETLGYFAADAGGDLDDGALLISRGVPAHGRARATLAGRSVPAKQLAEVVTTYVNIHGQTDQLRLATPAQQRAALDRDPEMLSTYRQAYARWRDAQAALASWEEDTARTEVERRILENAVATIDAVGPVEGEDDALRREAQRLTNVDDLRIAIESALRDLDSEDTGAISSITRVLRELENISSLAPEAATWAESIETAQSVLNDAVAEMSLFRHELEADPARLEEIHARRAALTNLARQWGPELSDVIAWANEARAKLAALDNPRGREELTQEREVAQQEMELAAQALTEARRAAATRLIDGVNSELAGLSMPGATFGIEIIPADFGPDGADDVVMTLQPHPSAAPLPLARAASGGELSRIMLALEVNLAAGADQTFIFDEIDAGIGGSAGFAVGTRLARLAKTHQVIVVTHLPQVAAFADRHLVAHKTTSDVDATTTVRVVDGEERMTEIARMLSGSTTTTALDHASELIERAAAAVGEPDQTVDVSDQTDDRVVKETDA